MKPDMSFEASLSQLPAYIDDILDVLSKSESFCLALEGNLGAGKTYIVGLLLYKMGLNPRVPVASPTYTILNDYEINSKRYGHLDLYKMQNLPFDVTSILENYTFDGLFIEWPQIKEDAFDFSHHLRIEHVGEDTRSYSLSTICTMT